MASTMDAGDSFYESRPQSILDVIEEKNRALNKKGLLHRAVIIFKLCDQNYQETGQFYDKLFKDLQNQFQCEPPTGLLLIYPHNCVHVVETSQEVLLEVIRNVEENAQSGQTQSKLLIVSHDIPGRLYHQWSFRFLDIQAPKLELYEPTESADKLVIDMLTQLLKLGSHLARTPKASLKIAMETLHDKVPELLPQQVVIGYLLENEEDCIIDPTKYLQKYQLPYDVTLGGELVWPMPIRLFPYN